MRSKYQTHSFTYTFSAHKTVFENFFYKFIYDTNLSMKKYSFLQRINNKHIYLNFQL